MKEKSQETHLGDNASKSIKLLQDLAFAQKVAKKIKATENPELVESAVLALSDLSRSDRFSVTAIMVDLDYHK